MNVKNVVKVMNFHSLLRVDKSRKTAKKYAYIGDTLADMIDNIVNNRNILLDYKVMKVYKDRPVLNIYLGGDMGFCANLNSSINRQIAQDEDDYKILVGRKLHTNRYDDKVILQMTREEFKENHQQILDIIDSAFREKKYSQINLVYNHYYSASEVEFMKRQLFPLEQHLNSNNTYDEDFVYEGDIEPLLTNMIILYMQIEVNVAGEVSSAALDITRQNTTTESLKKIDEREEAAHMSNLRQEREKQFSKVIDNYTTLKHY